MTDLEIVREAVERHGLSPVEAAALRLLAKYGGHAARCASRFVRNKLGKDNQSVCDCGFADLQKLWEAKP